METLSFFSEGSSVGPCVLAPLTVPAGFVLTGVSEELHPVRAPAATVSAKTVVNNLFFFMINPHFFMSTCLFLRQESI
jgi:hypothetical protein